MIIEKQTRPGDMQKFVVMLDETDITNAVTDAQVFQDVFSPNWTANIIVLDTMNLLMTLPIRPGSRVSVTAQTHMESETDDEKTFEFIVASIGDKQLVNTGTYSYVLACVDEVMFKQRAKNVSRGFSDKKVSSIVSTLASEFLGGSVDVTETDDSVSLVIPTQSPLDAISWLSKMATKDGAADFFFFQTDKNKFSFKSFEDMFASEEESMPITLTNKHMSMTDDKNNPEIDYMLNIGQYFFEHFDGVSNMHSGYYKNTLLSYDLINKSWDKTVFTFGDDCKKDAEMKTWDNPIFEGSENASISFKPKHPGSFGSNKGVMDLSDMWQTSRKSSVQKADQERLIAQMPGGVGTWKWLGKNITVDLPSQEEQSGEKMDKYRRGRYVVVAIAHMFSKATYAVNLEMVKKRLNEKQEGNQ